MAEKRFLHDTYGERTDDETRQHYDDWAKTYDWELTDNGYATPTRSREAFVELVDDHDAQILDVGCGTGLFGRQLTDAGYRVIDGCDYSTGMLAEAETTGLYRSLFEVNLNAPPMTVDGSPVESGRYDAAAVVGVFSFGHVEADAMDEIVRVVRPGGVVVIGLNEKFWNEGSLAAKIDALEAAGTVTVLDRSQGDHLPGTGLAGWVISLRIT